jgi:hypothetical protein
MKFEEAFDLVHKHDRIKAEQKGLPFNGVSIESVKGAEYAWNMISLALASDNGLEDIAYVDANSNIISMNVDAVVDDINRRKEAAAEKAKTESEPKTAEDVPGEGSETGADDVKEPEKEGSESGSDDGDGADAKPEKKVKKAKEGKDAPDTGDGADKYE